MNTGMPLWCLLTEESQEALKKYQKDRYGKNIKIPIPATSPVEIDVQIEDIEEIDKLIRQPRSRE